LGAKNNKDSKELLYVLSMSILEVYNSHLYPFPFVHVTWLFLSY